MKLYVQFAAAPEVERSCAELLHADPSHHCAPFWMAILTLPSPDPASDAVPASVMPEAERYDPLAVVMATLGATVSPT